MSTDKEYCMTPKKPIALVDMDGTLCDYQFSLVKDLNRRYNYVYHQNIDAEMLHLQHKDEIISIRDKEGWWRNLHPIKSGIRMLKYFYENDYRVFIATKSPRTNKNAWTEKLEWIEDHIWPLYPKVKVIMAEDKSLIMGQVLVDDFPGYMRKWLKNNPHSLGIMPNRQWNQNYHYGNYVRYDDDISDEQIDQLVTSKWS